jgi:Zn-dependent M28 family amino/carboxypeptidase
MVGAHFDSWHPGTGATDNGSSSAVVMEVMRILSAVDAKPRRTIRMALWTGEEQGLLGSGGYVRNHFGDRNTMELLDEHESLAAYFNLDNGGGKIRGVYCQGNIAVMPIFEAWLRPFADLGATTLTTRDTGGTDHLSFDRVGLPGFQFIQDPMDYSSRSHHSNMDLYERVHADDVQQAATIMASFVWHAAQRDEMLPRKPLPEGRAPRETPAPEPAPAPAPAADAPAPEAAAGGADAPNEPSGGQR